MPIPLIIYRRSEEVNKIQTRNPGKNDFIPEITTKQEYSTLHNIVFKDAPYCCYYNGNTIYLKFISLTEGYLALSRGEPKPQNINAWFDEKNHYVMKFEYLVEYKKIIRFSVFHNGKKYGYDIVSQLPSILKVTRWIPYGQTMTRLEFVLCI